VETWCGENKKSYLNSRERVKCLVKLDKEVSKVVKERCDNIPLDPDANVSGSEVYLLDCDHKSFCTLQPPQWVNDVVLMASIRFILKERENCWSFRSTFFSQALLNTNALSYASVKKHSSKAPGGNIFNLENVFFPINLQEQKHWTLGYVHMTRKLVYYYDPMGHTYSDGKKYQRLIHKYLREEHISLFNKDIPADWCFVDVRHTKGPKQKDLHNCGPLIVMIVDAICTLGVPPEVLFLFGDWDLTDVDMNRFRHRMGNLILQGELPAIQDLPAKIEGELTSSPYNN
jgi:Ulp1 family protease